MLPCSLKLPQKHVQCACLRDLTKQRRWVLGGARRQVSSVHLSTYFGLCTMEQN